MFQSSKNRRVEDVKKDQPFWFHVLECFIRNPPKAPQTPPNAERVVTTDPDAPDIRTPALVMNAYCRREAGQK
jgi:hypothetical protein